MWTITVRSLEGKPQEYQIGGERVTVGRLSDNTIVIDDLSASRHHAELKKSEDGSLVLRDLGSTNGTYVNRVRIEEPLSLRHNDVIRIGEHVLHVTQFQTGEKRPIELKETQLLSRDVFLESIDQHAVMLYEVSRKLNTMLDLESALEEVSALLKRTLGAAKCQIILAEHFDRLSELGFPTSIARRAIESRSVVFSPLIENGHVGNGVSASLLRVRTALCVPVISGEDLLGLIYMYKTDPEERPFDEKDFQLAVAISHQTALTIQRMKLIAQIGEEQRVRHLLQMFVSPKEADYIIQNYRKDGRLPGLSEKRATVLFADIADSTGLAERMQPQRFGELLRKYYLNITDIIFRYEGLVNKFLGDGVMAVFGITGSAPKHEARAVAAGLEILEFIEHLRAEMNEEINIGVGINTGQVMAGYVGTRERVELTVIGDTVNVAAGFEANARPNRLIVGPATMAAIVDLFPTQRVGSIRVKGRTREIQSYEVLRT